MHDFVVDCRRLSEAKEHFREVIHTTKQTQIGVMVVAPFEEFSEEPTTSDVVLLVTKGEATLTMDDAAHELKKNSLALIPAGTGYAIHNSSKRTLRMITVSSPPMLPARGAKKPSKAKT